MFKSKPSIPLNFRIVFLQKIAFLKYMVNDEKTRPKSAMSSRTVSSTSLNSADQEDSLDEELSITSSTSSDESEDEEPDVEKGQVGGTKDEDADESLNKDDKDSLDSELSD